MSEFRFHPVEIDHRETTSQFTERLYRLVICLVIAGMPIAFWSITDPNPQFHWSNCMIAGAFGAVAMGRYSHLEEMPLILGAFAGMLSGCGVYAALVGMILELQIFNKWLALLVAIIGALPGLILFNLMVWTYYSMFDMSELPSRPHEELANDSEST
jgi:hypothetical protein